MIIAPAKQFLIDFKINNPSDLATHYVRAVVKNAISGATLATLNLTDNGSGYFSKEWMTPNDPTGNGLQISVMTTVYDDAGYTSESPVYGTTLERHVIRDLASPRLGIGGAGAGMRDGLDEKRLEKMMRRLLKEIKFPEYPAQILPEKYDDSKLLERMESIAGQLVEGFKNAEKSDDKLHKLVIDSMKQLLDGFKEAEKSDDELHALVTGTFEEIQRDSRETKLYVRDGMANMQKTEVPKDQPEEVPQEIKRKDSLRKLLGEEVSPMSEERRKTISQLINGY